METSWKLWKQSNVMKTMETEHVNEGMRNKMETGWNMMETEHVNEGKEWKQHLVMMETEHLNDGIEWKQDGNRACK